MCHPLRLGGAVGHQPPPHKGPDDRRQALDHEHPAPAQAGGEIARHHRHPQQGRGIAHHQQRIGAGALAAGEPARLQDQHGGQHRAFHHAQHEARRIKQPDVGNQPHRGGQRPPADQPGKDQLLDAAVLGIDRARDLEQEITQEEQRAQQRRLGRRDVQVGGHAGCGAETEIGAVEIGQAVGDENHRQQQRPAPVHLPPIASLGRRV